MDKRFNISFMKERVTREYMEGHVHGVHPTANAGKKDLKAVLREIDIRPFR